MDRRFTFDRQKAIWNPTSSTLSIWKPDSKSGSFMACVCADSWFANGNNPRLARRLESVIAMFFGAALGAVLTHYSISATLCLAGSISAVCSAALFHSVRTSDPVNGESLLRRAVVPASHRATGSSNLSPRADEFDAKTCTATQSTANYSPDCFSLSNSSIIRNSSRS
jgi:hypothetical protein